MSIHDLVARYAAAIWGDLSAGEIDALYDPLHTKGQRSIYISCNRAECSALANSFDQLFKRLNGQAPLVMATSLRWELMELRLIPMTTRRAF